MSSTASRAPADSDGRVGRRPAPIRSDPHLFRRDKNGMVKLKINLSPEEAALIEEAANGTPLMVYVHRVLIDRARFHARRSIQDAAPEE